MEPEGAEPGDTFVTKGRVRLAEAVRHLVDATLTAENASSEQLAAAAAKVERIATALPGRLSVRYRRPTPLHRPMVFEGWTDQVDGRRVVTRGTLTVDGSITAEAEGLFVVIDLDRAVEYFGERAYERRQSADPLP